MFDAVRIGIGQHPKARGHARNVPSRLGHLAVRERSVVSSIRRRGEDRGTTFCLGSVGMPRLGGS